MRYIEIEHVGKVEEDGGRFVNTLYAVATNPLRWQKPDGTYDVYETDGWAVGEGRITVYDKDDVEAYIQLFTKIGEAMDEAEAKKNE